MWAADRRTLRVEASSDWTRPPTFHAVETAPLVAAPDLAPFELGRDVEPTSHWVEIVVRDEEGRLVPNARCVVIAADGSRIESMTGANGRMRLDDIAPGACRIEFPGLDGSAVSLR